MVTDIQTSPRPGRSKKEESNLRTTRRDLLDPAIEQWALKVSIAATALIGVMGVGGALMIGSRATMFDGMYSVVDVMLTFGSLAVSKLVTREPSRQFQFGYWHLEPMVGAVQSAILATACLYGVVDAIQGLMSGGYDVSFGYGTIWAGIMGVLGMAMAAYIYGLARSQRSLLLQIDFRSWLLSGVLSLALFVSYGIAIWLKDSTYREWVPYVDPMVLLLMSFALLPMPVKILFDAMREVLEVAPEALDRRVHALMDELVRDRGLLTYSSYVSQVGRVRFVEIHILVPRGFRVETVDAVDSLRQDIETRLDAEWPHVWLTVDMTANPEWI
jgi:predicted Co/Zn/Cd cation transporter (cation efflux family)